MNETNGCPMDDGWLTDYILGELSADDRQAVEHHLQDCERCRHALDELRTTMEAVGSAASIDPSADLTERIVNRARVRAISEHIESPTPHAARAPKGRQRFSFGTTIPEPRFVPTRFSGTGRLLAYAAAFVLIAYLAWDLSRDVNTAKDLGKHPGTTLEVAVETGSGQPDQPVTVAKAEPETPAAPVEPPHETLPELPDVDETVPGKLTPAQPPPNLAVAEPQPAQPPDVTPVPEPPRAPEIVPQPAPIEPPAARPTVVPIDPSALYLARTDAKLKARLLEQAGGEKTHIHVTAALYWLAEHQDDDGKWDGALFPRHCPRHQRCTDRAQSSGPINNVGQTSAAVLALLGDGYTPGPGRLHANCAKGLEWLMAQQQADGSFGQQDANHALATLALAEAYGMTGNVTYRRAAQRAAQAIIASYPVNTTIVKDSITAAFEMMALRTCELSGLNVAPEASMQIRMAMARPQGASDDRLARPTPLPPNAVTNAMLAGLYLSPAGAGHEEQIKTLQEQAERLVNYRPEWDNGDTFYWFTGTVLMRQLGQLSENDTPWKAWNFDLKKTLLDHQMRKTHMAGSWQPKGYLARSAGRVFSTALSALALESYYRYLPPQR